MDESHKRLFEILRGLAIQLLNTLDDLLGYPRTIPSREKRRMLEKIQN